jgi:acetyl esterase
MNRTCFFSSRLVLSIFFFALLPLSLWSQSCSTGKIDDRVAALISNAGPGKSLDQIKRTPIAQWRTEGPRTFVKLSEDSVKRIRITKDNIRVNVVNASQKKGLPVIINYHPGGFIVPLLPWMEYEAMRLSKKFGAVVFDIDYRVAPEQKFPVAVNDAYNAYLWVLDHAVEYGGDPARIILNGSSTGANLVALVTHKAKKEGKHAPIKLMVMNCPPTDNPMISYYPSYEENATGYFLTKDMSVFYFQTYLDKSEWFKSNPEMWPIYEKDLNGMPPSLIITTEFDILRDEGIAYGKKLEKAGNEVAIKCFPHQVHCFMGLPQNAGEIDRVYELMSESIVKAIGK